MPIAKLHSRAATLNSNVGVREEKNFTQKEIRVWQNEIKRGSVICQEFIYKVGGTLQRQIFFASLISRGYGLLCPKG